MRIAELPVLPASDATSENRVVILGAGYGGLHCAQLMAKYLHAPGAPEVVLVDRYSYHQIITELPIAAGGRAEAKDVSLPLEDVLQSERVRVEQAEICAIDLAARQVVTTRGKLGYSVLLVAVGSITAFYGVPGLAEHALTLKSVEDAEVINASVRQAHLRASAIADEAERRLTLSFIIGGAGLTGVELAGELAETLPELARTHGTAAGEAHVSLVEAAPNVLPSLPDRLQARAAAVLSDLGVHLALGSKVTKVDEHGVTLAAGHRLAGNTVIWTGGIMAPPLLALSGLPTASNGQVPVDQYLRVPSHPEVFVVGDAALLQEDGGRGGGEPTAQVALKQAETASYNILAPWNGWQMRSYVPASKGLVVSVGSSQGVASVFHVNLTGRKVMALKALIEEGYRYSVTGKLGLTRA
jgi:NADH dehydrogenase